MKQFIYFVLGLLLVLANNQAKAGDVFSLRCESGGQARPYFITFNTSTKVVIFETPPVSESNNFETNAYSGDVASMTDANVGFRILSTSGQLDFTFNKLRKTMTWPGLDELSFRRTVVHPCVEVPVRSILSFRTDDIVQNPISIRCDHTGYAYFTIDPSSKRAVFERGQEGRWFRGEVTLVGQDEVALAMEFDVPSRVVWSKSKQTITVEGIEGDAQRPTTVLQCQEIAPRTILELYRKLRR